MSVTVGNEHHQAWTTVWKLCPAIFLHFAAQNFCACKDQKRSPIFLIFTRNLEQIFFVAAEIFLSRWVGVCKSKPIRCENPITRENIQHILEDKMRPKWARDSWSPLPAAPATTGNLQYPVLFNQSENDFLGGKGEGNMWAHFVVSAWETMDQST